MRYIFGEYELDLQCYELRQAGKVLKVQPKVFDVLVYLIQHRDTIVSKEELFAHVWPKQFISEATLSGCIRAARKALGDDGQYQRVIQTVHGRGYRFVSRLDDTVPSGADHAVCPPSWPDSLPASVAEPPLSEAVLPMEAGHCCATCGSINAATATFCTSCGCRQVQLCPSCAHFVCLPAAFCPTCGQRLTEPVRTSAALGVYPRGRFVGREAELSQLQTLLRHVQGGHGQVAVLRGPAAIGKSWLLNEFRRAVAGSGVTYMEGRCTARGRTVPFQPLRGLVRQYCGLRETDPAEMAVAFLARHGQRLGQPSRVALELLGAMLGGKEGHGVLRQQEPEMLRAHLFTVLAQLFVHASRQQPLVMAIEDLHWMDASSVAWFQAFLPMLEGVPILLLATWESTTPVAWLPDTMTTYIPLPPLSTHDSYRLLQSLLPQEHFPSVRTQAVMGQAAGHPYLLGEGLRVVTEPCHAAGALVLPDTIRGVLVTRVEQLPRALRRLLQAAAVLGRTFSLALLQTICESPATVEADLLELERRALCYEVQGAQEPTYVFKHDLLQEVAYRSLELEHRQTLHAAVAQALERRAAGARDASADLIAHHYRHAARHAEAVEALRRCAAEAVMLTAYPEALDLLHMGQEHLAYLPAADRDAYCLPLILQQAQAYLLCGRAQEAQACLLQHQAAFEQSADPRQIGQCALLLSQTAQHLEAWEQAADYARLAVRRAHVCDNEIILGQAYSMLAMERYWAGQAFEGVEYSQQAVTLLAEAPERYRLGMAYFLLGLHRLILGDFAQALEAQAQVQTIGQALQDLELQGMAAWATGWIKTTSGACEEGIRACQYSLALGPDALNTAFALGWMGYGYLEHEEPEEAIGVLEEACDTMRQLQYRRMEALYTLFLGEAHLLCGSLTRAYDAVRQAESLMQTCHYTFGMAWVQRTHAKLARAGANMHTAQRHLAQAMQGFSTLHAAFEQGRSSLLGADLAWCLGDCKAATELLAEAYGLFQRLQVPVYMARVEQEARRLGLSLLPSPPGPA